jgi:hypothetical protein
LKTVSLAYISPSTRATLAHLGVPLTTEICNETVTLPPHEMPGEIVWRVDVLKWHVRKTLYYLASIPRRERVQRLLDVEQELMCKAHFDAYEAQAVAEAAIDAIKDLSDEDAAGLTKARKLIDGHLAMEWSVLVDRYMALVRDCSLTTQLRTYDTEVSAGSADKGAQRLTGHPSNTNQ